MNLEYHKTQKISDESWASSTTCAVNNVCLLNNITQLEKSQKDSKSNLINIKTKWEYNVMIAFLKRYD